MARLPYRLRVRKYAVPHPDCTLFVGRFLVLRPGAAHGSLLRQFGAGATVVVTDQTMRRTG